MSWWMYGRDETGRRVVWQVDTNPMQVVFLLGLVVTLFAPAPLRGPMAIYADGIRFLVLVG